MMEWDRILAILLVVLSVAGIAGMKTSSRQRQFERGRKLSRESKYGRKGEGLRWGSCWIPEDSATQHFLAVGTTGSGKSLVQRLLMKSALLDIKPGADKRALILDAKNDTVSFLDRIGSSCPVYTLNPFDGRSERPIPVAWDIAADITSASRALNLAAALIPAEKSGSNRYFTDAARMVVSGVIESLIAHSPGKWTFADLVLTTLSMDTTKRVLKHVYFIAETKGSISSMELRLIEDSKIACARKFFSKITSDQVKYDVVNSYGKLMELVK